MPSGFTPLILVESITGHLRDGRVGMRATQPQENEHARVGSMIGLPHVLVGYFPAGLLRLLPSRAGIDSVGSERGLNLRYAFRAWLHLRTFGGALPGSFLESGRSSKRSSETQKQAIAR